MGEGTVFSLSVHTSVGGGTPILPTGGYSHPARSGWGVPPSLVRMGDYPIPDQRWGVPPSQVRIRSTPSQVRMGGTPILLIGGRGTTIPGHDGGTPSPPPPCRRDGVPSRPGARLGRRGGYPCVHAGGLSSFLFCFE